MTTSLVWPKTLLVPSQVSVDIRPNNTSGGIALNGFDEQIVGNTPGRWGAIFAGIDIRTTEQVRAWRALRAALQGRLNPLLIPIYDSQRAPSPSITAQTSGAVSNGAVTMDIEITSGAGTIDNGMQFSAPGSERLYEIVSVDDVVGAINSVTFFPPLRNGMADGGALNFTDPHFRVRLASDREMDIPLDLLKFSSPTVNFVEAK